MASPTRDDYESLTSPWRPLAKAALKHYTSLHGNIEIGHATKEGDLTETDSSGAVTGSDDDALRQDLEYSTADDTDANDVVSDGVHDNSDMGDPKMADIANDDNDSSIGDGAQVDGIEITETDDDTSQKIDMKCAAVPTCVADSGDHRKVVSHVFGRNKTCTRELPNDLWIFWCRKHYQRFMYRAKDAENWHTRQLELVRKQLQIIEDWGEVRNWTIALRKAEHNALAKEDKKDFTHPISPCWERFLVPYLGLNKTFAHIRQVLVVIEGKFNEAEYRNRDRKLKTFPGIEFLSTIQKAQEAKKPAAKKGEVTYKKITVDQPAFKGKGAANREYIKQMAAKRREASNTPESSGTSSKKRKSPSNSDSKSTMVKRETSLDDNATNYPTLSKRKSFSSATMTLSSSDKAFSIKRKSMTPVGVHNASPTHQDETPATKRRRLTRGYEKHGSDSDDATLVEKEHAQEDEQKIDL